MHGDSEGGKREKGIANKRRDLISPYTDNLKVVTICASSNHYRKKKLNMQTLSATIIVPLKTNSHVKIGAAGDANEGVDENKKAALCNQSLT